MTPKVYPDKIRLPEHIAIIMDGNGRWATQRGRDRIYGHRKGADAVREVIEASAELGIGYLTLYAFSTENWSRPDDEINALMGLMVQSLNDETQTLIKNDIRLRVIGDIDRLAPDVRKRLKETIELTSGGTRMVLVVALSYSSRWEIIQASRGICLDAAAGKLSYADLNEDTFRKYLETGDIPDPELMIRTSGELRVSNFLLWQLAYTELYFTDVLWPDFGKEDLYKAIEDFQKRERRFGKTSEQLSGK
ncbi:MAG: isoprenyl transferase [Bacteroidales bacterium]|jgi:undecaprenyl diphosphate synthase|nr:isoprenyl transferase [Bacteroidales bacterium]